MERDEKFSSWAIHKARHDFEVAEMNLQFAQGHTCEKQEALAQTRELVTSSSGDLQRISVGLNELYESAMSTDISNDLASGPIFDPTILATAPEEVTEQQRRGQVGVLTQYIDYANRRINRQRNRDGAAIARLSTAQLTQRRHTRHSIDAACESMEASLLPHMEQIASDKREEAKNALRTVVEKRVREGMAGCQDEAQIERAVDERFNREAERANREVERVVKRARGNDD